MWDDFQSYPEALSAHVGVRGGSQLAWGRFGAATADNLIANTSCRGSMGGDLSGPLEYRQ